MSLNEEERVDNKQHEFPVPKKQLMIYPTKDSFSVSKIGQILHIPMNCIGILINLFTNRFNMA